MWPHSADFHPSVCYWSPPVCISCPGTGISVWSRFVCVVPPQLPELPAHSFQHIWVSGLCRRGVRLITLLMLKTCFRVATLAGASCTVAGGVWEGMSNTHTHTHCERETDKSPLVSSFNFFLLRSLIFSVFLSFPQCSTVLLSRFSKMRRKTSRSLVVQPLTSVCLHHFLPALQFLLLLCSLTLIYSFSGLLLFSSVVTAVSCWLFWFPLI